MERKLADRLARGPVDGGQRLAELDHGRSFDPLDQMGEDAIDRSNLRVTEAIDVGQEQVRHLAENSGIVLGPILFGAVQFLAQIRRGSRHGYPTSAPVVPAGRMT